MSRILIFSDQFPDDFSSGRYLRVNHLCRELTKSHECFLVDMSGKKPTPQEIGALGCKDGRSLARRPKEKKSFRRHLRLSNERFLQLSAPLYCAKIVAEIGRLVDEWRIEVVINFSPERAELLLGVDLPKILDYTDCDTLTIERVLAQRGSKMRLGERLGTRLQLLRQMRMERSVLSAYDVTTTIAEPDRKRMLELSGISPDRVIVIPNGVSQEALDMGARTNPRDRSLVFWGNLNFSPNWTAVRYFYEAIFLPYLAKSGIVWHIFGGGAGPEIAKVLDHPQVRAEGFKDDLFKHVVHCGVMVNPMVEGSGLKNKVLEAFAVGLPVVTTSLGVEAIRLEPGRHCEVVDDPEDFAAAVLQLLDSPGDAERISVAALELVRKSYSWKRVGSKFLDSLNRLVPPASTVGNDCI